MPDYDVIVVGGGPAGATAAYYAARAGLKTALIEKYPLPRHKTCGGGAPTTVSDLVPVVPDAFVELEIDKIIHTWEFDRRVEASINKPGSPIQKVWLFQRSIFDNHLVQLAAAQGAEVIDGVQICEAEESSGLVRLRGKSKNGSCYFQSQYVIDSSGAACVVAKQFGLRRNPTIALGMELEVPVDWANVPSTVGRNQLHLEYGAVSHGYAWVFPKGDHLNIGAGLFRPSSGGDTRGADKQVRSELKGAIERYLQHLGIEVKEKQKWHAHPLPVWTGRQKLHAYGGRVIAVGDAAGLINPLFGDGISYALKSGKIAAECIILGRPNQYSKQIQKEIGSNFAPALLLAKLFYKYPETFYDLVVTKPGATATAARLLSGEQSYHEVSYRIIYRVLQRVVRSKLNVHQALQALRSTRSEVG